MQKAIFYSIIMISFTSLIFLIINCSIAESVINIPEKYKLPIHELMPQGWSFFTRSPREEMAEIYKINKNKELVKISSQCAASENLFGLSRRSRKIGMELSIIASKINDSSWISNRNSNLVIHNLPIHPIKIDGNLSDKILKKGDYLITAEIPIPWAWSKNNHTQKKTRIIRIQLL